MFKKLILALLTGAMLVMPVASAAHAEVCIRNAAGICNPRP